MTQEEKHILLVDLCARLPYGVSVQVETPYSTFDMGGQFDMSNVQNEYENIVLNPDNFSTILSDIKGLEYIKPYLRPISSVTVRELNKLQGLCIAFDSLYPLQHFTDVAKFLYEHHIDFNNLIERGLALEAPKEMYNFN